MPFWTFFGLQHGQGDDRLAKTHLGRRARTGVLGMPRFAPERCEPDCEDCAAVCPTAAITVETSKAGAERLAVDYGRCVVCQLCVEACPAEAATASFDWAFGTRERVRLCC